ncbi:zinc finger HIT domain-containing protein 3 [Calliphora vicina]|uniref:zinc finger HIT domain-containing protein 3 n=1 Tax=Calliphora vicina TaxID=7373 RepID=UPI00325BBA2D
MSECIVCNKTTDKYKCLKCFAFYCSLDCYKQHKESPECLELVKNKTNDGEIKECPNEIDEPTVHEPFKTEDTVALEKLKALGLSDDIKNLLYNPHLRNLLKEIDTAPNAWKAIRAAMQEPLFLEFADECLKIVEPGTDEDNL